MHFLAGAPSGKNPSAANSKPVSSAVKPTVNTEAGVAVVGSLDVALDMDKPEVILIEDQMNVDTKALALDVSSAVCTIAVFLLVCIYLLLFQVWLWPLAHCCRGVSHTHTHTGVNGMTLDILLLFSQQASILSIFDILQLFHHCWLLYLSLFYIHLIMLWPILLDTCNYFVACCFFRTIKLCYCLFFLDLSNYF